MNIKKHPVTNSAGEKQQKPENNQPSSEKTSKRKFDEQYQSVENAHKQAEADMELDPDNIHSPNDDLDEGETSRLGEDLDNVV